MRAFLGVADEPRPVERSSRGDAVRNSERREVAPRTDIRRNDGRACSPGCCGHRHDLLSSAKHANLWLRLSLRAGRADGIRPPALADKLLIVATRDLYRLEYSAPRRPPRRSRHHATEIMDWCIGRAGGCRSGSLLTLCWSTSDSNCWSHLL